MHSTLQRSSGEEVEGKNVLTKDLNTLECIPHFSAVAVKMWKEKMC